jgi:hypothetical protein
MTAHEALLNRQGFAPFRRAVAMLCMALAFMLSWQSYISLMDRLDHAHHHSHFANPLAGDISYCVGSCGAKHHSHAHKHLDGASAHHHHNADASADHHDSDAPSHQHNGDAAIVFLAAQSFVLTACTVPETRCEFRPVAFATFNPRGPDHPPKTLV